MTDMNLATLQFVMIACVLVMCAVSIWLRAVPIEFDQPELGTDASDDFIVDRNIEDETLILQKQPVPGQAQADYALIVELDDGSVKVKPDGTVVLSEGLTSKDIPRIIQQAAKIVHYAITMDSFSTDK